MHPSACLRIHALPFGDDLPLVRQPLDFRLLATPSLAPLFIDDMYYNTVQCARAKGAFMGMNEKNCCDWKISLVARRDKG